jgi:Na+:H+ antiporter, NhaA family
MPLNAVRASAMNFAQNFRHFSGGASRFAGPLLIGAACLALILANSAVAPRFFALLNAQAAGMSTLHWINDGLMAIFFLLVGLEIKRELLIGELSTREQRVLPGIAALGGMIAPAIIYLTVNAGGRGHPAGWAIPTATDIAFALGVLALMKERVPASLKVFLTALAVIDDLGAVLIIAIFYSAELNSVALIGAAVISAALILLNRRGVTRLLPYLVLGVFLWVCVLKSGVHATVAGVVLALTIPLNAPRSQAGGPAPLLQLEHAISPWVGLVVIPLFGFANAGVSLATVSLDTITQPVPLGVALGLACGKQVGVMTAAAVAIGLGWSRLPPGATWLRLYGVSLLCGIGFTMSLFIGLMAFPDTPVLQNGVKLGVFLGSIVSASAGLLVLGSATSPHRT